MKALGKTLFWIGFVAIIAVVLACLLIIANGPIAFATIATPLSVCAVILVSALLMLLGRTYEKSGLRRDEAKRLRNIQENAA